MFRKLVGNLSFSPSRGDLEDQHVLGQPALVATHHGGDPKRIALLTQQEVAAGLAPAKRRN